MSDNNFDWLARSNHVEDLTIEELVKLNGDIQTAIVHVKDRAADARKRARTTFGRVSRGNRPAEDQALRHLGLAAQRVQTEMSLRKRAQRTKARVDEDERIRKYRQGRFTFEQRFIAAAREALPARQFRDICRMSSGVIPLVKHPECATEHQYEIAKEEGALERSDTAPVRP